MLALIAPCPITPKKSSGGKVTKPKEKATPKGKKGKSKSEDDDTLEDIGKDKNRRIATKTILKVISRGDFPATGDTRGESVGLPPKLL
ncbi:hypothetical protein FDENT_1302 [Fusarium denticulatum]|uniref:Uncharacterized protein n=1 Tax=Fusarium denticulatum TaxID=48507 RepID=A0A8H5XI95_9HYPO|nr:hypothetical protein FDENT_1302 [Fusarium denticulatum]